MKEYLDPTDWSLKLVNVDNDAAQPDWIEVPEGAERLYDFLDGYEFHKNGNELYWNEHEKEWMERGYKVASHVKMLWRRQKPRVRVYATLSQSKFKRDLQALKELLIEERPILEALRSVLDRAITEAATDWNGLGWRETARKQILQDWQPDWTQAPKGCDWFAVDFDGTGTFMNYEPEMFCGTWVAPSSTTHPIIEARPGTNFGYKGDWRDSLRKCKKIGSVIIL